MGWGGWLGGLESMVSDVYCISYLCLPLYCINISISIIIISINISISIIIISISISISISVLLNLMIGFAEFNFLVLQC